MGILRVYCLKTLNKLPIYPLGNTPSAPSGKNLSCSLLTYASLVWLLSAMASAYALTSAKSFFIWFCSCSNLSPWEDATVQLNQWNKEWRLTLVLSPAKSPQSLPTSMAEYLMDRVDPFQGLSTVSASTTPWHNNVHIIVSFGPCLEPRSDSRTRSITKA